MKTYSVSLFLLNLLNYTSSSNLNYPLIREYLQWHNIKAILFLTCERPDWEEMERIKIDLKFSDIYRDHWDISDGIDVADFDYHHFFARLSNPIAVIVEWECNTTHSILNEISKRTMFHYERHWLIFGKSEAQMFFKLSDENINVDAEVTVAQAIAENEYELSDVYNPSVKRGGLFRMERIGYWSNITGLVMNETNTKFERRQNLGGITLLTAISIPTLPPNTTFFEHLNSDDHRYLYLDNMNKGNYRMFQLLSELYNFKMLIRRSKIWGKLTPEGRWLGVVGLLNRSEIDMSLSALRWESDRYGVLDQTTTSFYVEILFIFRHPKSVDAAGVFLSPFVSTVWLLIGTIGIATSILIRCFFLIENHLSSQSEIVDTTTNDGTYYNSFLIIFGILFQQGCADNPSFFSTRIVFLTYLMFSVFIYQFYGSFIVGSLLTEAPKTIKTMKQLLHSGLDFAMDEIPYIPDTFSHVIEDSALEMYRKIIAQPKPFLPLFTGLQLVKEGTLAFNTDGIYAYAILKNLLTDDELCDLQQINYVEKVPTGPGLPRKSPLREIIKIGFRKLYETGIVAYVWKTWISHLPKCARSDVDVVPVDMIHFSSALYVFGYGMQVSLFIFLGELYCLKLRHMRQSWKENGKT